MTDLPPMSAAELTQAYGAGTLSPVEVAEAALAVVAGPAASLNAVASSDADMVHESARASACRWKAGRPLGPLDGVPISFKDSFHIKGLPRWHGTACHEGVVSGADALPVIRAREAGMIVTCKTTMPDFAMIMSGISSEHGVIRNAWDPRTSPGGSSSGAGPSVVLGAATIALGTDMVGSVRIPAALSGLASIKPTQGRIAYDPPGAYRSAGPMARTVGDVTLALGALGRFAHEDFYSLDGRFVPAPPPTDLKGQRIAVWKRAGWGDATDAETLTAVDWAAEQLSARGAELIEIKDLDVGADDYMAIHWNMLHVGAPDYFGLPAAARGRIAPPIGALYDGLLSQSAIHAASVTRRVNMAAIRVARQLASFDHVLSPAVPVRAFPAELCCPDPRWGAASHQAFACWFNQIGWPAATVPVHQPEDGDVPVSVQIAGRRFDDARVLGIATLLETARGFAIRWPQVRT
ncbi:amidase [Acetobacter estunensis NRIC 0472]|uniref:amidase family protein n=1 Tax=Acetobacter estunensis TaxID=104097 RepID=UPI00140C06A9|nr:amidase family protein [Acetobacter estunensis]GBQ25873.1 amidase [Acetobacter estunensis NRIC 0472]